MKKLCASALAILMLFCLFACKSQKPTGEKVASTAMLSILELNCTFQASKNNATGIILDSRGYVLTNAHVITESVGSYTYTASKICGKFHDSSVEYLFDVVSYDLALDLAVIKFKTVDVALTPLSTSEEVLRYGQDVYAIGNAEGYGLSVMQGLISAPKRFFSEEAKDDAVQEYIQTNATVTNGMSGGALLNTAGDAIGLITFKIRSGNTTIDGISFAIPTGVFLPYFESIVEKDV